ncbi:hypothetical protein ACN22W_36830 [Burkholderia theae]|uniref:hypothetical protein n=1 Tax=Burkholderia theae TaxID=3143496 RepID=UPI003AFAAB52
MADSDESTTLADWVIAVMSDGAERTLTHLLAELDTSIGKLRRVVRSLESGGLAYVDRTIGPQHEKVYKLLSEKALDERSRSQANWWPKADPVVTNAFFAMVRLTEDDSMG